MTINELQQRKKELGYSNERLAELSGVSVEVIEQLLVFEMPNNITYADRFAIERVLREESEQIRETVAPYLYKQQGAYRLEDYYAMADDIRVELIDGVIYDMASPTTIHQELSLEIAVILRDYVKKKKGNCKVYVAPLDVQLNRDDKTMVQPDVIVVCDRDKIIRRCIYGAPDFIVEVLSPSTSRKDTTIKLRAYKEAGVREYWIIDPDKKKVVVYDFCKSEIPVVYGFEAKVPVGILEGNCEVNFAEICEGLAV